MGCGKSTPQNETAHTGNGHGNVSVNARETSREFTDTRLPNAQHGRGQPERTSKDDRGYDKVKDKDLPKPQAGSKESVSIKDEDRECCQTGEEPKQPIPLAAFQDGNLGIGDLKAIEEILNRLDGKELFCDPDFPADDTSLSYSSDVFEKGLDIQWLRPKDLENGGKQPLLCVDDISRHDIKQGNLGDCWFLSSCAAVCRQEKFMKKIIPENQPLYGEKYTGLIYFRFWRFGEWVTVYIDDRLPTSDRKLIYASSTDPTEFWVALIEKAYAKLHGSYEAIEGGQAMDALVDLTGGLAERYDIKTADLTMFKHMKQAHAAGSFIACSKKGDWRLANVAEENGLVSGHAYTVTNVVRISHGQGEDRLLRIRNPWGNETEWKGPWNDGDRIWESVSGETKEAIGMKKRADGEFWMSYGDFCQHFQEITICTLGPDFDGDGLADKTGHVEMLKGKWVEGENAGGSRNDLEKFATNPQYILTLNKPDPFNPLVDDPETEGKCGVVIALMQEHRRSQRHLGVKMLQIGFFLYKTEDPAHGLPEKHFRYNYESAKSGVYVNLREVSCRFELDPGHYAIIPSTFTAGQSGSFMLRVYAQSNFKISGSVPPR